jgi:hypothetical protein
VVALVDRYRLEVNGHPLIQPAGNPGEPRAQEGVRQLVPHGLAAVIVAHVADRNGGWCDPEGREDSAELIVDALPLRLASQGDGQIRLGRALVSAVSVAQPLLARDDAGHRLPPTFEHSRDLYGRLRIHVGREPEVRGLHLDPLRTTLVTRAWKRDASRDQNAKQGERVREPWTPHARNRFYTGLSPDSSNWGCCENR